MKDCAHNSTSQATVVRELAGHTFSDSAELCNNCGSELWSKDLKKRFQNWIDELSVKQRIQFKLSGSAETCLDHILTKFPGTNKTLLVRAMIAVYLNLIKLDPKYNDAFNQLYESEYYLSFESDTKFRNFPTDVKPLFFFEIQSWARVFNMKSNEIAYEAFHLMMALCVSEDVELKEVWSAVALPQIEIILKVA